MRILGVDPGSNATGYGVVEYAGGRVIHIAHGVLRSRKGDPLALRLAGIHQGLTAAAVEYEIKLAAVERVFMASNPRSALILGQARGAALAALAGAGLAVTEFSAREVKKGVVGNGAAAKSQVQGMVTRLLDLETAPPRDAADALAVAICQAHSGRLAGAGVRKRRRGLRLAVSPERLSRPIR